MNDSGRADVAPLRIATYNIHSSVGVDGRHEPGRIARVIRRICPDLIGLQEVDYGYWVRGDGEKLDVLENDTGLKIFCGPTLIRHLSSYGNALLTKLPVSRLRRIDLSVPGYEPRGALVAYLEVDNRSLRTIVTHFGLRKAEREKQLRVLQEILDENDADLTILLGDFNEWSLWGPARRRLDRRLGKSRSRRTYPSRLPVFRLDRIWCHPSSVLENIRVHKTPLARTASDHLPLVAEIHPAKLR